MSVPKDQQPWSRFLDITPTIPHPRARYYPANLADLIEVIKTAEAESAPRPSVRAVGSHWAPSEAAVDRDGFIVETRNPATEATHPDSGLKAPPLYNVIGKAGCLTDAAVAFFREQGVAPFRDDDTSDLATAPDTGFGKFFLGHFEAGVKIYEAYNLLDQGFDPDLSLAGLPGFDNYLGPWAMITIGGAGGQTIGGVISTGTHGGDLFLPPIADCVQAMHVVGVGGKQYWFERPLPDGARLTSDAKLLRLFGEMEIHHDDETLDAAMVSVGRFGIIYSVVLRVVRQYALDQVTNTGDMTWTDAKAKLLDFDANFRDKRFLQIIINPNGHSDAPDVHTCFITTFNTKPLAAANDAHTGKPLGREERGGDKAGNSHPLKSSAFSDFLCDHAGEGGILSKVFTPLVDLVTGSDVFTFVSDLIAGVGDKTVGALVADLLNHFVENDHVEFARFLCEKLIGGSGRPPDIDAAISYAVLDQHNYLDQGCTTKGVSLEAFLDAKAPETIVALVETIFAALDQLQGGTLERAHNKPLAYAGAIALRFTKASRGLIAMQQHEFTCSLELQGLGGCHGNDVFMEEITERAINLGARMHWGQYNEIVDSSTIQDQYGAKLERWRAVLASMTHNGRSTTFSTPFTFKKGLEVVQPRIGDFSVIPRFAPAGEGGVASWGAVDNPPGTTARFSTTPVGGTTTVTDHMDLLTARPFVFEAGEKDLTLEVDYLFGGRNRADASTIRIRGFDAGNPDWLHQEVATPTVVSGRTQFAVRLVFLPETWSRLLRVETIEVAFGPGEGDVRWALFGPGAVARDFTAMAATQVFLNRPHLVGDTSGEWLFVHHRAGLPPGSGPAPTLKVRFRLGSDPLPPT